MATPSSAPMIDQTIEIITRLRWISERGIYVGQGWAIRRHVQITAKKSNQRASMDFSQGGRTEWEISLWSRSSLAYSIENQRTSNAGCTWSVSIGWSVSEVDARWRSSSRLECVLYNVDKTICRQGPRLPVRWTCVNIEQEWCPDLLQRKWSRRKRASRTSLERVEDTFVVDEIVDSTAMLRRCDAQGRFGLIIGEPIHEERLMSPKDLIAFVA